MSSSCMARVSDPDGPINLNTHEHTHKYTYYAHYAQSKLEVGGVMSVRSLLILKLMTRVT